MNSNSQESDVNLNEQTDVFVCDGDGADGLSNDDSGCDGQHSEGGSSDDESDDQQSDGVSSYEYSDGGFSDECFDGGCKNDVRNVGEQNDVYGDNVDGHENDGRVRKKVDGTYKRITELTGDDIRDLDFGSEIEATEFYSRYAKLHGFVIRKKNVRRDCKGNVVMRQLVCNREGLRDKKHFTRVDRVREHRPLTRTDCRAQFRVQFDYKTCRWVVGGFVEGHNHELAPSSFVHLIPAYRGMTDADKSQVESLHLYRVRTCHIMGLMVGQKGGYSDLGFCKKDVYNHLDRKRRAKIQDGDAFAALSYLQAKADSDPSLFVKFTTTSDGRLQHMFWCDGASRVDFECFGDVLAFDATYKKNKYNKPLVIFSGTNHHGKTTIFACALVDDETVETYKWVLETLLEAMLNKHPNAVVTDGDNAMRKAIKAIFPKARHRLCSWHLQNNACENVKNAEFLEDFNRAMYGNFTVAEFEDFWEKMIEKHNISSRKAKKWIKKTYKRKRMWATAYLREEFFGRIRTTSRCEGINSFIKQHVRKKNSLVDFLRNFDRVLNDYRNNEHEVDYKSLYGGEPVMTTCLKNIELGASKIYTRQIFAEVKGEMDQAGALIVLNRTVDEDTVRYRINKFCSPLTVFDVTYDRAQGKFVCDCRGFESRGLPCRHIFCAMKHEHMDSIPSSLILKRWTKTAKSDYTPSIQMDDIDSEMGFKLRFGALAATCNRLCHIAARKLDDFTEMRDEIRKLITRLETRNDPSRNQEGNQMVVGDPMMVKTKGAPSKKRNWRKRKYKCSYCHKSGHNIAKCPRMITNEAEFSNKEESSSSEYDIDDQADNDSLSDGMYMRKSGSFRTSHPKDDSADMASAAAFRRNRSKLPPSTQNSVKENVEVSRSAPLQDDIPPIDPLHTVVNGHKTTNNDTNAFHGLDRVPIAACRPAVDKSFQEGMPVFAQYPGHGIPVQGMAAFAQYPGQGLAAYPQYSEQGMTCFTQYPGVPLYPHIPAVPIYPQNPAAGLWNQYYGCTQDADGAKLWPSLQRDSSLPHK